MVAMSSCIPDMMSDESEPNSTVPQWEENQAKAKNLRTRTFSGSFADITNVAAQGLGSQSGSKRPLLEPKTPARRNKGDGGCLAVFEDGAEEAQSAVRRPASPPHVRPKSRGSDEDCMLGESRLDCIEEVTEADLPPIQDFSDRVSEQEQYWHAFGGDDGPDGFGRPQDLARMLAHGTARACFEAETPSDLWGRDFEGCGVASSPGSLELNRMAWPSMSPSPKCKLADPGFGAIGLGSSPLMPALDVEMDIDSGSDC